MTATLTFPGQVPFNDPAVEAGGCELGLGRCVGPAEVEVRLPATNDRRRLCRDHVGYYMLAAASTARESVVEVRKLLDL
jgi:hypothetical protein